MSKVRLYGDTSGYVDLKAPDVAGDVTITLPNTTGPFATETYVDDEIAAIPEIAGIGSNVVSVTKTDTFTTTASGATLADITGLAVTITPTSASSKILLICTYGALDSSGNFFVFGDVTRDSTAIGVGDAAGSRTPVGFAPITATANRSEVASWSFLDSPATTSAVTYQARLGGDAGTKYLNRTNADVDSAGYPRGVSTITAIEVAA